MAKGALSGLSVVECGRTGAAAYAAKLLADLGAEVVKVEPPSGDPARHLGPYPGGRTNIYASGTFLYLNTNKRGVTLDITTMTGADALDRLVV
ncbi:MAG: CoA transferase, partial [Dehalococcoidia bacterium]